MDLMTILATAGLGEMAKMAVKGLIDFYRTDCEESLYERTYEALQEYLTFSYRNNALMHTIVFRGVEKSIFDLYIPLTLCYDEEDGIKEIKVDEKGLERIKGNGAKSIIVDNAGMGKSTIVKYLATQAVMNREGIPIIIELRKLKKDKGIVAFIEEQFDLFDKKIDRDDLKLLLKEGGFVIFFDGYDEVSAELRQTVTEDIQYFVSRAPENTYILTSREESELSSFSDFFEYSIKPLKMEEAFALIRKYDNNGKKSADLIEKIEAESNLMVLREFLINPLLVSLLYKTYMYKEEIPYKKIEFYKQVYEALFNDHDKSKDAYVHPKKSGLDINDFENVLTTLGFLGMREWRVEYEKEELIRDIQTAIKNLAGSSPNAQDFLEDMIHAVPLFQKDGNAYRWIHKSFMEYFAAKYICFGIGNKKERWLAGIVGRKDSIKYKNFLDFCYEMDLKTFRKCLLLPWLEHIAATEKKVEDFLEGCSVEYRGNEELRHVLLNIWMHGNIGIIAANEENQNIVMGNDNEKFRQKFKEISARFDKFEVNHLLFNSTGFFFAHESDRNDVVKNIIIMKKVPALVQKTKKAGESWREIEKKMAEIEIEEEKIYYLGDFIKEICRKNADSDLVATFLRQCVIPARDEFLVDDKLCRNLLHEIKQEIKEMEEVDRELLEFI